MRALDYLFFCRPLLLLPVWTVYFLTLHEYASEEPFSLFNLADLLALSLVVSGAYVINQIYDLESDRINQKLGFFDSPISFSVSGAWKFYAVLNLAGLVYAITLRPGIVLPLSLFAVAGILYSAPPLRAKDRPLAGLLFNALPFSLFTFWVAVLGDLEFAETRYWLEGRDAQFVGALFCAIAAVYLMTTLPDRGGDEKTGKRTLGVVLGVHKTSILGALFIGIAVFGAFKAEFEAVALTSTISLAFYLAAIVFADSRIVLLAAKGPILILTIFAIFEFPLYGLFCLALIGLTRLYYLERFKIVYPRLI